MTTVVVIPSLVTKCESLPQARVYSAAVSSLTKQQLTFIPQYVKAATSVFKMRRLMYYRIKLHAAIV